MEAPTSPLPSITTTAMEVMAEGCKRKAPTSGADEHGVHRTKKAKGKSRSGKGPEKIVDDDLAKIEGFFRD